MKTLCYYPLRENASAEISSPGLELDLKDNQIINGRTQCREAILTGFQLSSDTNFEIHVGFKLLEDGGDDWTSYLMLEKGNEIGDHHYGYAHKQFDDEVKPGTFQNVVSVIGAHDHAASMNQCYQLPLTTAPKDRREFDIILCSKPGEYVVYDGEEIAASIKKNVGTIVFDRLRIGRSSFGTAPKFEITDLEIVSEITDFTSVTIHGALKSMDAARHVGTVKIKNGTATPVNIATVNDYHKFCVPAAYKVSVAVPDMDVWAFLPFNDNLDDVIDKTEWTNHYAELEKDKQKPNTLHENYLRCSSAYSANSYFETQQNVGKYYSAEFFFRFSDNKKKNCILRMTPLDLVVNYKSNGTYELSAVGRNRTITATAFLAKPNIWHHVVVEETSTNGYRLIVDGIISSITPDILTDNREFSFGGWDGCENKDNKSVVDFSMIRIRKSKLSCFGTENFLPPEIPYAYSMRNGYPSILEYAPLMEDLQKSGFFIREDKKKLGLDPITAIEPFENSNKLMHLTSTTKNGLSDATAKTTWAAENVGFTKGVYGNNRLNFSFGAKWGYAKKTGGNTTLGDGEFTVLCDFMIRSDNAVKPNDPNAWENQHDLVYGTDSTIMIAVMNSRDKVKIGMANDESKNIIADLPFKLDLGRYYRIVVERQRGYFNAWLNGIRIVKNVGKYVNYTGSQLLVGCYRPAQATSAINGEVRNVVIWNKALMDTGDVPAQAIEAPRPANCNCTRNCNCNCRPSTPSGIVFDWHYQSSGKFLRTDYYDCEAYGPWTESHNSGRMTGHSCYVCGKHKRGSQDVWGAGRMAWSTHDESGKCSSFYTYASFVVDSATFTFNFRTNQASGRCGYRVLGASVGECRDLGHENYNFRVSVDVQIGDRTFTAYGVQRCSMNDARAKRTVSTQCYFYVNGASAARL